MKDKKVIKKLKSLRDKLGDRGVFTLLAKKGGDPCLLWDLNGVFYTVTYRKGNQSADFIVYYNANILWSDSYDNLDEFIESFGDVADYVEEGVRNGFAPTLVIRDEPHEWIQRRTK
jgi:hypothetical protein